MDKAQIQKNLDDADRYIKRGEKLVEEQEERVEELRRERDDLLEPRKGWDLNPRYGFPYA